jgi:hypothetical protein
VSTTGSNIGDTGEAQEPAQSGQINSAWWSGTAPTSGIVNFATIGRNFDDFDTYLSEKKWHLCYFQFPQIFINRRVNVSWLQILD